MTSLVSHRSFLSDILAKQSSRRALIDPTHAFPAQPQITSPPPTAPSGNNLSAQPTKGNVVNYVPAEETIRNDYEERYGVSGEFGSNYVLGAGDGEICEEYPALKKLMTLKSALLDTASHPPLTLHLPSPSPISIAASLSPVRFDVILVNPLSPSDWDATAALPVRALSADPGFVFLWVGSGDSEGLERGRECFAKWGFRRAEDIVWVKINRPGMAGDQSDGAGIGDGGGEGRRGGAAGGGLFASQKEHCLVGIRGTVRRATDTRFVHCNVDTDVMIWEDDGAGASPHPPYLHTLIENFCLGTRRLELFGTSPRRGWVTATLSPPSLTEPTTQIFDPTTYPNLVDKADGREILPYSAEIDLLRPKSPQRRGKLPLASAPGGVRPPTGPSFRPGGGAGGQQGQQGFGGVSPGAQDMSTGGMGMGGPLMTMGMGGMGPRMGGQQGFAYQQQPPHQMGMAFPGQLGQYVGMNAMGFDPGMAMAMGIPFNQMGFQNQGMQGMPNQMGWGGQMGYGGMDGSMGMGWSQGQQLWPGDQGPWQGGQQWQGGQGQWQ